MLKNLKIQNLILVEYADIPFNAGLNILTGETGSGKSAIMHGLRLIIGDRTDTALIRKGCDKGIVEGIFDISSPTLLALLEEGGIDHDPSQHLIIKREISQSAKSRVYINNQMAQLSFLKKLGYHLIQVVSQHANQSLFSLDYHRNVIDLYGGLAEFLEPFQLSYDKEIEVKKKLEQLIQYDSQRLREIDMCKAELEELDEARIKPGEEEELFSEYTFLNNAEELSTKIDDIVKYLSGERHPLIATLNRQKQCLDSLSKYDSSLQDIAQSFQTAILELQEIFHFLNNYLSRIHYDPIRLKDIDARLSVLNRLKRKYGSSVEEIMSYYTQTKNKLSQLENIDHEIEKLQLQKQIVENETNQLSEKLSEKRIYYAAEFQKEVTLQLQNLNMSQAQFFAKLSEQKRTREGDDRIEFFICPNVGEREIPLRDGASGGEISRILLALQSLLAGKDKICTLIFDEVDANIGGETATIVGNKLRQISEQHQVICITHFPQVASQAHHHLQISKKEKEGRTLTIVEELNSFSRQVELSRMAGLKTAR